MFKVYRVFGASKGFEDRRVRKEQQVRWVQGGCGVSKVCLDVQ